MLTLSAGGRGAAATLPFVLDSGTGALLLESGLYDGLLSDLAAPAADAALRALLGVSAATLFSKDYIYTAEPAQGLCPKLSPNATVAQLNARLPALRLALAGGGALSVPAVPGYLAAVGPAAAGGVCASAVDAGSRNVLGWTVLSAFTVVFNVGAGAAGADPPRVGFAPPQPCGGGGGVALAPLAPQPPPGPPPAPPAPPAAPPAPPAPPAPSPPPPCAALGLTPNAVLGTDDAVFGCGNVVAGSHDVVIGARPARAATRPCSCPPLPPHTRPPPTFLPAPPPAGSDNVLLRAEWYDRVEGSGNVLAAYAQSDTVVGDFNTVESHASCVLGTPFRVPPPPALPTRPSFLAWLGR